MNSKTYCIAILLSVFATPCMAQVHPHAKAAGSTVAAFSTPAKPDKAAKPVPETPLARSIARAVAKAQHTQPAAEDSCICTCRSKSLTPQQLLQAETQLQRLRDTVDPTASFEKYPQLLQPDSCICKPKLAPKKRLPHTSALPVGSAK